ncbi:MAG TPA: hypothetical protein VGD42_00195 [Lysobacter sp.]
MSEILALAFQWAFSVAGLMHLVGVGLLASAAIVLSPSRHVGKFFVVAFALWVIASTLSASTSSTVRTALAGAIWALSVIALYALFLGVLVAKGKGSRTILITAVALLLAQVPLSLFSGLYLACYVGHDCL